MNDAAMAPQNQRGRIRSPESGLGHDPRRLPSKRCLRVSFRFIFLRLDQLRFVSTVAEVMNCLPQRLSQFRQARRTKEQDDDRENDQQFLWAWGTAAQ